MERHRDDLIPRLTARPYMPSLSSLVTMPDALWLPPLQDTEATQSDTFVGFSYIDSSDTLPLEEPSYRSTGAPCCLESY